jgi:hypothetical protein
MNRYTLAIIIWIPILICASATATPEYLKQTNIPPVILSYTDLDRILVNVKSQVATANKSTNDKGSPSAKATIEAGEESISLPDWDPLASVKSAPNPGSAFRFVFTQSDSSVSRVEIDLSDFSRKIVVEGTDSAQVKAIYSYLKDEFTDFSVSFGGYGFRSALGFLAWTLGGTLIIHPFLYPTIMKFIDPSRTVIYPPKGTLLSVLFGVLVLVALFLLPWGDWLTGFAVYSGSTSFIDRNINWMSFVSLVATPIISILTILIKTAKMTPNSAQSQINR